ncbi:unnamed protein product [Prorocentrum cordatum]|uniref:Uncharacterized protein n=1 Tax=Prorocentrum cordatum TaxID=2364126 RepID=A0ABN9W5X4_9DINO|nr:unnamed protein product [Polarella glacialis]
MGLIDVDAENLSHGSPPSLSSRLEAFHAEDTAGPPRRRPRQRVDSRAPNLFVAGAADIDLVFGRGAAREFIARAAVPEEHIPQNIIFFAWPSIVRALTVQPEAGVRLLEREPVSTAMLDRKHQRVKDCNKSH